jgi:hypothetical protein
MLHFRNHLLGGAALGPAAHDIAARPASADARYPTIQLLTPETAAAALGLAVQTLARWRCEGYGPRHVRLSGGGGGGRVAYRLADIEAWLAGRVVASTAQRLA